MKLINKFTLWYLGISAVTLLLGGIIVFYVVQSEILKEEGNRLKDAIEIIAKKMEAGTPVKELSRDQVSITELPMDSTIAPMKVIDKTHWYQPSQDYERELKASASYKIHGKHYLIKMYTFIGEPDEIASGVLKSLVSVFILLLIFVWLMGRVISGKILMPFNRSMKSIQSFQVKQKESLLLSKTSTTEFDELNRLLEKMTAKAREDYKSLKEFSENASHELQTPLAIIRGKLELLMETTINDEQAKLIMSAQNAVQKLSAINQSLILLTKLENHEYDSSQQVNLSELVNESIAAFDELIEMKSIQVEKQIEKDIRIPMNPVLANILFTNLMSNAIRHNLENGMIRIQLNSQKLVLENSGNTLDVPADQLFQRFKKGNQSGDSIGLGLAIVKQISDLHHFKILYRFDKNIHKIEIQFQTAA